MTRAIAHPHTPGSPARTEWPFVGRAAELLQVNDILVEGQRSGVLLVGAAGVGKTRLAEECLAVAEQQGFATAKARATRAARGIPFGAIAALLPPSPPTVLGNRAEMIRRMSAALVEQSAPKRVALLIDDAHLLDDATATFVHQLATNRSAFVVATVRATEPMPDAILALWKDSLAARIVVDGLSVDAAEALLSSALGSPVDRGAVRRLVGHTRGNVMFLRELVLEAVSEGSLRLQRGLWRQVRPLRPSERLVELVEARLSALDDTQRALLEVLAFGEPIGRRELGQLAASRTAEELERLGLLVSEYSGRRLQMRLGHPLYGDVLRATTSALRADAVSRGLAEAVESTGARRREDALRIATWRLKCGGASSSQMLAAAHAARWGFDFDLAARLADAAVDADGGFPAKLLAVQVAALRGHSLDAEGELAELAVEATTDAERGAAALARLENVAFNLAKVDQALELAEVAEAEISDPAWKDAVRAMRASFLMVAPSGGPRAAVDAAQPLLTGSTGGAKAWACFTASCSLTRLGRLQEALRWAEEGRRTHEQLGESLEWPSWIHVYSHGEALAHLGRFAEAEALALEQYEAGIVEGSIERQAYFAWQLGTRVGERGGVHSVIQRLREAAALYEELGRPFYVRHCLVQLSLSLALAGDADEATATLAGLDAMNLPPQLFAYSGDLLQARAWTAAARGDLPAARSFLEEGLAFGEQTGDILGQATALHALARLGRAADVAPRLTELASEIEGELFPARARHAAALADGNTDALRAVSGAFEGMSALLLAAESAGQEAAVWDRTGEKRKALAARRRAEDLASACDGASTPTLHGLRRSAALTEAERRVANLARDGWSNKDIAFEFNVSVRTVEHQLQDVYAKLGISRREDLAGALPANT